MLIELDDVCRAVGLVLGRRDPKADDRIQADLGGESIDVLNIVVTLEQKYGIVIDEAAMANVSTVRDLYDLALKSSHAAIPAANPARPA
ncbi:MAG: acyl carrier protein [Acidobacteria bacterium]|nr:acyl carrier protein [Acidobacteriota bacterium]